MGFDLQFTLRLSSAPFQSHKGEFTSMGWADRKLKEAAKRKEDERLSNEYLAKQNAQKLAEAPQLWDRLGEVLKREVDVYNEGMPEHLNVKDVASEPDTSRKVLTSRKAEVTLTFHRTVPQISYKVKTSVGPYDVKADADNGTFFFEVLKDEVWLRHKSRQPMNDGSCDVPSAAGILLDILVD
jgi:hypothetical protein